jgi:hypothetical protein
MSPHLYDPQTLRALVRPQEVHRALYLDPSLFDLEMRQLWRNTWIYLGHDSAGWSGAVPLPKIAPDALARAIVKALQDGHDVYPGGVAAEWLARWRENPKVLERELAMSRTGG